MWLQESVNWQSRTQAERNSFWLQMNMSAPIFVFTIRPFICRLEEEDLAER